MKLETILQAALNSMIRGHHTPFCYSAHVIGQGYVNKGEPEHDRLDYLRQLERSVQSEIDNMGYSPDYAEPGCDKPAKGILFANWNVFPRNFDTLLEKAGYTVEWSDEWSQCEDCNRAVRTSPDSYGWKRYYVIYNDCEIICADCVKDDLNTYEEYLLNKHTKADTFDIDWSERGFTRFNDDSYENGLHAHQTDKPSDIIKQLPKDCDYLFAIPDVSQFYLTFDCWIRKREDNL
jgi:hypothetical protein